MKCSFSKLFLLFGGLASSLSLPAHAQYTGCGGYSQQSTCPYQAEVEASSAPSMSPWGLPCWLSVKPAADASPADGLPEVYQGCEAGCPVDVDGCAASQSSGNRDIWSELYSRDCCPAASVDDASLTVDAMTAPAEVSDLGCLAADERHSQGQSAVESLNQQQQGLSGTHLTVRLRVGPVAEDDEIVSAPVAPAAEATAGFDDEESCMRPHYDCLGSDCCLDEYDCYCHPRNVAANPCEAEVKADEIAPAVANRASIEDDPRARDFKDEVLGVILTEELPLVPEITRQDLLTPALPSTESWADEAISQADGKAMCRGMLQGWAFMARCTGECLRSLSHSLSELADDFGDDSSYVEVEETDSQAEEAADSDEAACQSIPEEYLGW